MSYIKHLLNELVLCDLELVCEKEKVKILRDRREAVEKKLYEAWERIHEIKLDREAILSELRGSQVVEEISA